jgi:Fe-S-cluster containining protein
MINVTEAESDLVSKKLNMTSLAFKEKYIEESLGGQMIMNTIPCHFLKEKKCSIYNDRFAECRDFPHLHKTNFNGRLFGTLMHYSICPIIFNVVEQLKIETGFLINRA